MFSSRAETFRWERVLLSILIVAIDHQKNTEKNIADDKVVWSNIKLLTNIPIVDNDRDCERPTVCRQSPST